MRLKTPISRWWTLSQPGLQGSLNHIAGKPGILGDNNRWTIGQCLAKYVPRCDCDIHRDLAGHGVRVHRATNAVCSE